jgi:hypothetical protein
MKIGQGIYIEKAFLNWRCIFFRGAEVLVEGFEAEAAEGFAGGVAHADVGGLGR